MAAAAFLFDLDGTLWDSHPLYAAALSAGSGRPRNGILHALKRPGANVVRLADELGVSRSVLARECRRQISLLRLYPGVRSTLEVLGRVPLGVVTNLPASLVKPILDEAEIASLFDSVVCAAGKPRARGLTRALRDLGVDAGSSYYVGDSSWDAEAARAAGLRFAWASYGYTLHVADCDVTLARFSDLLRL